MNIYTHRHTSQIIFGNRHRRHHHINDHLKAKWQRQILLNDYHIRLGEYAKCEWPIFVCIVMEQWHFEWMSKEKYKRRWMQTMFMPTFVTIECIHNGQSMDTMFLWLWISIMVVVVVVVDDGDVEVAKKDGLTYGTTREIGQFSIDHINVYVYFKMTNLYSAFGIFVSFVLFPSFTNSAHNFTLNSGLSLSLYSVN